jgi:hypothetical protein
MNITKRILSTLLAVVMMLSTFTAVFTVQVSAAEKEPATPVATTPIKDYVTKVYNNPEEKLQTMEMMREEGNYQLWVDKQSGEVAWVETDAEGNLTENILFSNPYDVAASKGSKTTKQELLSQIIVSFTDATGTTKQLYSYTDAALNDQITVRLIKGGVRVEYIIGREDGRKLIPKWIFDDSFQPNILANISKAVEEGNLPKDEDKWFINAWEKYDLNDSKITSGMRLELINRYPALGDNAFQNDKGKTEYPVLWVWLPKMSNASDTLKREAYIKTYCPDYTFEQLDADHEATGYVAEDEKYPVFKMALEYYLDAENGLTVRMPCNGLRYDASTYTLQNLNILPYMGASNYKNAGVTYETTDANGLPVSNTTESYTFFPDGSGALFNHAELGSSTEKLLGYVYGEDFAYHQLIGLKFHKAVRYPVYGIVSNELFYEYTYKTYDAEAEEYISTSERISCSIKTEEQILKELEEKQATLEGDIVIDAYKRGFAAFVEEADSLTRLQLYHGGALHNYSSIFPYFNPKASDSYNLSGSIANSAESIGIKSDRKYTGSFTVHYVMLTDDALASQRKSEDITYKHYSASWLGMAEAYRDHLAETGKLNELLTEDDVQEDIPLYIEVFGALETKETIATIPVWVMTPLTTFENVLTMYNELSDSTRNVKNINFKLTGFANGGMYSTMPYKLKWEENLGGADGFKELILAARKINAKTDGSHLGLYPDFDFAYVQSDDSFDGMTLKKDAVKTLDNRYTQYRYYDASVQNFVGFYKLAISPSRYSYFYEELISNYKKFGLQSMSVGSLGNALNSDFDEDDPYNREQSKDLTKQALSDIRDKGYSLMTDGGNAYTWSYVDHILNVELDSSRYLISSATVPFIGSVLHGYVQFAGAPLNEEGDVNYAILRAIENGAGLYFILSYQNTTELKEDKLLSEYYSIRYDIWLEDVAKHYNKLNTVLSDVQTKVIIGHEFLVGDRVLDLDELEADIENRLEGAIKDQDQHQNDLLTSESVAVAEAWNMLYNATSIMQELSDRVDEINKELEKRYNVSTGTFYDPTASDKNRPTTNLLDFDDLLDEPNLNPKNPIPGSGTGVINRYIYTQRVDDAAYYTGAIKLVKTQFDKLKESAVFFAQSATDLQAIMEQAGAMEAELMAAYNLINTTPLYDGKEEVRKALLKDAAQWMSGVSSIAQEIEANGNLYLATEGKDFLNKESACYFLPQIQKVLDFYFNAQFTEGGDYYEYYKEGGQYYTDYNGEKVNAEQYPVDLVQIQRDLKKECPLVAFDEENIWAQVQDSEEETEDEKDDSNKINNNHIVVVTYGDRDADTFEKTPYKSIILNYNSYAVRVTYNGTIYTVPSGGYIVIDYNN